MTIDARLPAIVEALRKRGPEYAPLVDALTEYAAFAPGGYVVRRWSNLPDGALVGPMLRALHKLGLVIRMDSVRKDVMSATWADDANAAVVDALEAWLGLKTESEAKG